MKHYSRPDVKIWILDCFDRFSNMYLKGWITTREIQDYIKQTYNVLIKQATIANIIHYETCGIIRSKIGYTIYYKPKDEGGLGSRFIKDVLKMNSNITIYRMNNDNVKYDIDVLEIM